MAEHSEELIIDTIRKSDDYIVIGWTDTDCYTISSLTGKREVAIQLEALGGVMREKWIAERRDELKELLG